MMHFYSLLAFSVALLVLVASLFYLVYATILMKSEHKLWKTRLPSNDLRDVLTRKIRLVKRHRKVSMVTGILWSVIGLMFPIQAHAQYPNGFQTLCPAGAAGAAQPLPFGVTYDPNTQMSVAALCVDARGNITSSFFAAAGSASFSTLTSGTNTTAAMIVGTGASLTSSGTGTITANTLAAAIKSANIVTLTPLTGSTLGILLANGDTLTIGGGGGINTLMLSSSTNGGVQLLDGGSQGITTSSNTTTNVQANTTLTLIGGSASLVINSTNGTFNVPVVATKYSTSTNCSSNASPAVCAAASAGSVALPAGTNSTLVVQTTAVTASSQIILEVDESLSTKLSVTCNSSLATLANPVVTARSTGVSFIFTIGSTLVTNPACVSYQIIN
jgi:hypothetical protein